MASSLPMKTTEVDLDKLSGYLRTQVGWVSLDQIRKAIPAKHAHNLKVEAMRHLGLLERDGENVKLSDAGREYAAGDTTVRAKIMRDRLRVDRLYWATLEWLHYNEKTAVTKNDVANYWHDKHPDEIGGAKGDALTDSTVFFMRMVGVALLGKFTAAGKGRDTNLVMDAPELAEFVTGEGPPTEDPPAGEADEQGPPGGDAGGGVGGGARGGTGGGATGRLSVATGLNVNVEIHIAADAKPATIEEIFKNMRKYLMGGADHEGDGD